MFGIEIWLKENQPGYRGLGNEIKVAIAYFTVAWSLFEYRALGDGRGWERIDRFVETFATENADENRFGPIFDYFHARYAGNGPAKDLYAGMLVRADRETRDRIDRFLENDAAPFDAKLLGSILIVYCLRNNLMHGTKWEYGLHGQMDNLAHSVGLLKLAMEAYCPDPASYTERMERLRRGHA